MAAALYSSLTVAGANIQRMPGERSEREPDAGCPAGKDLARAEANRAARAGVVRGRSRWRPAERWVPHGTWSQDAIVEALEDWVRVTGDPPRLYEWVPSSARALGLYNAHCRMWEREHPRWPSATTVTKHFGSWSDGLAAAGIIVPSRRPPGTLAERVQGARRLAAQGMRQAEIAALLEVTPSTVSTYLSAGTCGCGEPVIRSRSSPPRCRRCASRASRPLAWDRDTVLAAYRAWQEETGSRPLKADWSPELPQSQQWHDGFPRWPSAGEVDGVFGRWGALVAAAGDPPLRTRPRWPRDRVLAALRELADELGRVPRSADLAGYPGMPGVDTVRKRFGSWAAAIGELGAAPYRVVQSDGELIAALRAARQELHRPPRPSDLQLGRPRAKTLRRRFGSWQAALSAAGIEPAPPRRWPRERILDVLRSWELAHGRPPRASEWRAGDPDGERPSSQVVVRRFGSWALALEAAGLSSQPHRWTPELIIGALRNWKRTHGRAPTVSEWNAMPSGDTHPSRHTVVDCFGSWTNALDMAGVVSRKAAQGAERRARAPSRRRAFTDEQVIAALRRDADSRGRSPRLSEWTGRPRTEPGVRAVLDHFGSWNASLRAAGLEVTHEMGKWTGDAVIDALRGDARDRGHTPRRDDWRHAAADRPQVGIVEKLFGSWNAGLRAAGLDVSHDPGRWTRDTVLAALRRREQELGRPPMSSELEHQPGPDCPSTAIVRRRLGGWNDACRELGWEIPESGRRGDDEMLAALRTASWELGDKITQSAFGDLARERGWPSAGAVKKRFGSWNAAKRACGLPAPGRVAVWSQAEIVAALLAASRELGRPPTWKEYKALAGERGWPSATVLTGRHGGWDAVLRTAGLTPPAAWTHERVIAALRADAEGHGAPPRQADWSSRSAERPSTKTVLAIFDGSWNRALEAAGLPLRYERGWTCERVIEALRADARARGRPPRSADWFHTAPGRPTVGTVRNHFGSWNAGLRAAGLELNHEVRKWTRATVLDALRRLERELGRPPSSGELYRSPGPGYPTAAIVARRLGSWAEACRELGWPATAHVVSSGAKGYGALVEMPHRP